MKLAIGMPCPETVRADTAFCFAAAAVVQTTFPSLVFVKGQSSVSAASARNELVRGALASGATHLLMVDSDMVFPVNTIDRLAEPKLPVVGAVYRRRGHPHDLLGTSKSGEVDVEGLVEMSILGTGLMLIDMSVFLDWPEPWFRVEVRGDKIVGEDILFCQDLVAKGIPIHADIELSKRVGHLCQATLTEQGIQMSSNVAGFQQPNDSVSRMPSLLP